jgi:hypothetical protein
MPQIECGDGKTWVNGICCNASQVYPDSSGHNQCCQQALDTNGQCVMLKERSR